MNPIRTFNIRLNLFILLFLTMVPPALGDAVTAPSYWDAIFQLGYEPAAGQTGDEVACHRIETAYAFSRLVPEHVEADRELAATYAEMRARLSSLDAGNLYDLLPYSAADSAWRAIGITGQSRNNIFQLSAYDPGISGASLPPINRNGRSSHDFNKFGDFDFRTFIKPVAKSKYRFFSDLDIYSADLSAAVIPRMAEAFMTVISQFAAVTDPPPEFIARKYSLNQPSLKVLADFATDFPDFFTTITQFFNFENIISSSPVHADGPQMVDLRIRINRKAFAQNYPEIGATLERLDGMMYINGRIFDAHNRPMAYIELDSARDLFVLQYRIWKGRLLPINGSRLPGSPTGFSLTDQALTQFYAEFDIHLDMVGLNLDVISLQVPMDYFLGDRRGNLKVCLLQPPDTVKAGGRAFGFVPLWLIDMLIPSNVETITRDFFQALASANDGRGSILELESIPRIPGHNYLAVKADAEVLGNGTIKLAFNLQRRFAREQKKLIAEFNQFNEKLWKAFYSDYQKVKQERGCR